MECDYESDYSLGDALKVLADIGLKSSKLAEQVEDQLQRLNHDYRTSPGYTEIETRKFVKLSYEFLGAVIAARKTYKSNLKKLTR